MDFECSFWMLWPPAFGKPMCGVVPQHLFSKSRWSQHEFRNCIQRPFSSTIALNLKNPWPTKYLYRDLSYLLPGCNCHHNHTPLCQSGCIEQHYLPHQRRERECIEQHYLPHQRRDTQGTLQTGNLQQLWLILILCWQPVLSHLDPIILHDPVCLDTADWHIHHLAL